MLGKTLPALAAFALTALAGCASAPRQTATPAAEGAEETAPAAAPESKRLFDLPYVQRELPNGLKVIVVKAPFAGTVSVQIPVQTGSRNEVEDGKTGFAHFFEHMMFRGTPTYPAEAYQAVIKSMGADQNAYTDDDFTNYYTNVTVEDLDKLLEVEADRFRHLAYSEEQFRTEALAVKGEYLKNFSNPLLKAFERLQDLAYDVHTYGHMGIGYLRDIEAMPDQMEYAKTFFDRWYRPEYTSVIVVGDVEPEAAAALVEKHWGGWERGSYVAEIPQEPAPAGPRYEHVRFEGPTAPWIVLAWRGPAFSTEDIAGPALALAGEIHFGQSSPLYQKLVVKEQLADQFFYGAPRNRDPGLFLVAARLTKAEHAGAVVRAIEDAALAARTHTIGAPLLADTKSRLKYSFASGMNSAASIAATLATFVHYERDVETMNRYYALFDRTTPADLVAAADAVFFDANRSAVSISNDDALAGAGDFRSLDALVAAGTKAPAEALPVEPQPPATPVAKSPAEAEADAATRAWAFSQAELAIKAVEQRSESPLIDVTWRFGAGAANDPPGKKGLAVLTASMIAQGGTQHRSYEELTRAFYPLAAGLSARVDKEVTSFSGTVHRDNFGAWYDLVHEMLFESGFRDEDFVRLKQQQIAAIRVSLRANNDEELGKEALYQVAYGAAHPYGTLNLGDVSDLESITLDDVRAFAFRHYTLQRYTLGLAGGYDDAMRQRLFADSMRLSQARYEPTVIDPAPAGARREAVIYAKEAPAVAVSFGFPLSIRRGHPDWLALWLVRSWLGEHRNSSGRLYGQIREARGMNYGDYAYIEYFPFGMFLMQPEPGYPRQNDLFQVWLRPLRDNNDALFATRTALRELELLAENGLSPEGFESTRAFLRKFVANLTATQAKQLGYALDSRWFGTPAFLDYVRDGLDSLTLEQVNAAIRRHFRLDAIRFVFVAKDAEDLAKRLRAGTPSPITYNTDKPEALLAEDRTIARYPLRLARDAVEVVPADRLFE